MKNKEQQRKHQNCSSLNGIKLFLIKTLFLEICWKSVKLEKLKIGAILCLNLNKPGFSLSMFATWISQSTHLFQLMKFYFNHVLILYNFTSTFKSCILLKKKHYNLFSYTYFQYLCTEEGNPYNIKSTLLKTRFNISLLS